MEQLDKLANIFNLPLKKYSKPEENLLGVLNKINDISKIDSINKNLKMGNFRSCTCAKKESNIDDDSLEFDTEKVEK